MLIKIGKSHIDNPHEISHFCIAELLKKEGSLITFNPVEGSLDWGGQFVFHVSGNTLDNLWHRLTVRKEHLSIYGYKYEAEVHDTETNT